MEHLISQLISLATSAWDLFAPGLALLPFAFGAVSTANVRRTGDVFVFDVTATADADTVTASIPHGMGVIPDVSLIKLIAPGATVVHAWAVTTLDATNLILTKTTAVGSGNAGAQLRVYAQRPR